MVRIITSEIVELEGFLPILLIVREVGLIRYFFRTKSRELFKVPLSSHLIPFGKEGFLDSR